MGGFRAVRKTWRKKASSSRGLFSRGRRRRALAGWWPPLMSSAGLGDSSPAALGGYRAPADGKLERVPVLERTKL